MTTMQETMTNREKLARLATIPVALAAVSGLALWLWPPQTVDVSPLFRPPYVGVGTLTPDSSPGLIASVVQGQPVGAEAYWKSFRLHPGWHLAESGDGYTLVATVTNTADTPDTAQILVTIRVAERSADMLLCSAPLKPNEAKVLTCIDTNQAPYTSRWSRITLSAVS